MSSYKHCVVGLLIVWALIDRLDDVYRDIADIVYLLDVLVVIVYISQCNCWDYLLLHEDWGECSEGWAGACGWGGGGGGSFFQECMTSEKISLLNFFFQKCSWGSETHKYKWGGGILGCLGHPTPPPGGRAVGKWYTSSYDHDLWPVKILENSGLAVKSYHPETLAAEEKTNSDKTIRHSRRGMPNSIITWSPQLSPIY